MPVPDLALVEQMLASARSHYAGEPPYGEEELLSVLWSIASWYLDDDHVVNGLAAGRLGWTR